MKKKLVVISITKNEYSIDLERFNIVSSFLFPLHWQPLLDDWESFIWKLKKGFTLAPFSDVIG